MKVLFSIIGVVITFGLLTYLYLRQLGAISFFILALLFFILSHQQFVKSKQAEGEKEEKAREP